MAHGFMVAGTASGVGKTTVAVGLIGALRRRGLRVQPFKAGPDYIDPTYHSHVAGVPSRNLDTWLVPRHGVLELFARAMGGRDIAVVEGVMGLYDGLSGRSEEGSSAELAKLLDLPVLLVVDAHAAARSVAATVLGFQKFDPQVRLAGVVLNGVGSERHADLCREAVDAATSVPVLGALPGRDDLRLPERHLGLIPTVEGVGGDEVFQRMTQVVETGVDISRVLALAGTVASPPGNSSLFPHEPVPPRARIAVAMDRAFSFYYQDSLDLLEAWGGELAPFSPLEDSGVLHDVSGLYIGGGFPELYARELAANTGMAAALRKAAGAGMPVYAECGGLMYLGRSITDMEGKTHPMVGVLPVSSRIDKPRLSLGYRAVQALGDGPLLRRGEVVRGHEFHWSVLDGSSEEMNAYRVVGEERREGFCVKGVLASYVHLHLASLPTMAQRFVERCCQFQGGG
ncbi:MAG: cobyrinate a,c-diamide synthase [Chloroflexota bacterium]|nr:cobyrinate a,c-diamide synthase [Chloroflexota bacterium]